MYCQLTAWMNWSKINEMYVQHSSQKNNLNGPSLWFPTEAAESVCILIILIVKFNPAHFFAVKIYFWSHAKTLHTSPGNSWFLWVPLGVPWDLIEHALKCKPLLGSVENVKKFMKHWPILSVKVSLA